MLIIRLSRTGRTNFPTFSLVVAEKSAPVKSGKIVEKLGHYLPAEKTPVFSFEKTRVEYWISKGAQVSETAARLLKKNGVTGMEKFVDFTKKYQVKKKVEKEAGVAVSPAGAEVKKEEEK